MGASGLFAVLRSAEATAQLRIQIVSGALRGTCSHLWRTGQAGIRLCEFFLCLNSRNSSLFYPCFKMKHLLLAWHRKHTHNTCALFLRQVKARSRNQPWLEPFLALGWYGTIPWRLKVYQLRDKIS